MCTSDLSLARTAGLLAAEQLAAEQLAAVDSSLGGCHAFAKCAQNVRYSHRGTMLRAVFRGAVCVIASVISLAANAEVQIVRIGETFGLTHLPSYVVEDLHLVEKHSAKR